MLCFLLLSSFSLSFPDLCVFSLPSPPPQIHSMWGLVSAWLFGSGGSLSYEAVTDLLLLPTPFAYHPVSASFLIFHHSSSLLSLKVFLLCYFIFTFGLHNESYSLPFGSKTGYQNLTWVIPGWGAWLPSLLSESALLEEEVFSSANLKFMNIPTKDSFSPASPHFSQNFI